jgi:hypothetical protein
MVSKHGNDAVCKCLLFRGVAAGFAGRAVSILRKAMEKESSAFEGCG